MGSLKNLIISLHFFAARSQQDQNIPPRELKVKLCRVEEEKQELEKKSFDNHRVFGRWFFFSFVCLSPGVTGI